MSSPHRQDSSRTTFLKSYQKSNAPFLSGNTSSHGNSDEIERSGVDLPIWKVARATSAAPFYFKPVTVNTTNKELIFEDGGIGNNNPTLGAIKEVQVSSEEQLGIVVSIGTARGVRQPDKNPSSVRAVLYKLSDALGNPENVHSNASEIAVRDLFDYVRFNPSANEHLLNVSLDEWLPRKPRSGQTAGSETIYGIRSTFERWYCEPSVSEQFRTTAKTLVSIRRQRLKDRSRWSRFAIGPSYLCRRHSPCHEFSARSAFEDHLKKEHGIIGPQLQIEVTAAESSSKDSDVVLDIVVDDNDENPSLTSGDSASEESAPSTPQSEPSRSPFDDFEDVRRVQPLSDTPDVQSHLHDSISEEGEMIATTSEKSLKPANYPIRSEIMNSQCRVDQTQGSPWDDLTSSRPTVEQSHMHRWPVDGGSSPIGTDDLSSSEQKVTSQQPGVTNRSPWLEETVRTEPETTCVQSVLDSLESWCISRIQLLKRSLRPRIKPGYQRHEWKCTCGISIFGDFASTDQHKAAALQSYLDSFGASVPDPRSARPSSQVDTNTPSSSTNSLSGSSQSQAPTGVTRSTLIAPAHKFGFPIDKPAFFELCVRESSRVTRLGEICLSDIQGRCIITSDAQLFGESATS